MSAITKLKLPYKRFVAQVSTGAPRPKSTFISLMAENLEALKACPWREAADVPVSLVDHDFTKASHFSDAYDAFKMTGAWDAENQQEIAFAGMAAYRFTIPASARGQNPVPVVSFICSVSGDRFLKSGVRVAYEVNNSATPSTDWDVLTQLYDMYSREDFFENPSDNLSSSMPKEGGSAGSGLPRDHNTGTYLWLYVTLRDYTDWWDKYSATEARRYAIEGSAMLVGDSVEVEFDGDVTPDDPDNVLLSGGSSPTWLQPLPTVNVGVPSQQDLAVPAEPVVEPLFTAVQQRTRTTELDYTVTQTFRTSFFEGYIEVAGRANSRNGKPCVYYRRAGTSGNYTKLEMHDGSWYSAQDEFAIIGSDYVVWPSDPSWSGQRYFLYLCVTIDNIMVTRQTNDNSLVTVRISNYKVYDNTSNSEVNNALPSSSQATGTVTKTATGYEIVTSSYYLMLEFTNGVLTDMDESHTADAGGRKYLVPTITGEQSPWSVDLGGETYTVAKSSQEVTLMQASSPLGIWSIQYTGADHFFDASVKIRRHGDSANETAWDYGLAAALGDFSHAVATFEAGTQPSDAEVLGRLARMSRKEAGDMLYLHPENGALANELDVLRPVPRFWRTATDPSGQTSCQPGLSVWYKRATTSSGGTTVTGSSSAATGIVQRERPTTETVVTGPAFLQLTVLALRAPSTFASQLVLVNYRSSPATTNIANDFVLRFVVWRSPAEQWDGSNAFAMAAIASMPSIYRSDGEGSVAWNVDCTGNLLRFGTRSMTAARIGVSPTVSGTIAANDTIRIPLAAPISAGDVVLIAPEVLGFANGVGGLSKYFGRQADPAAATDAGKGWARFAHNLGWFPRVTGE